MQFAGHGHWPWQINAQRLGAECGGNENFNELRRIADDPVRHRQFLLRTSLIESVRKAAKIQ